MTIVPFTAKAEKLLPGEILETEESVQKDKKHISFICETDPLGDGVIRVGHGYKKTYGTWLELTAETVAVYTYYSFRDPAEVEVLPPTPHGLKIDSYVSVVIDVDVANGGAAFTVSSVSGMYKSERSNNWRGWNGSVFAAAENCTLTDAKLSWFTDTYAAKIWILGASYLGLTNPARWPYYLYKDGYSDVMIAGFGGMKAERGLQEIRMALTRGKPEFIVWHLGGNDADSRWAESLTPEQIAAMSDNFTFDGEIGGNSVNERWLKNTKELLALCEAEGITPVLSTMPSNPLVNHEPKNEWIRASGCRYIDVAKAVGAHRSLNWYPGMISADNVHPTPVGAMAMYARVLADFPEIMGK
ncbi:MAG: SGNH/GDSL hydrolase family protein [Ruminococcaceae bacterium]|nr:SGNH/GDSL hydrolase family protein [Oscillospiraceae bacterium]